MDCINAEYEYSSRKSSDTSKSKCNPNALNAQQGYVYNIHSSLQILPMQKNVRLMLTHLLHSYMNAEKKELVELSEATKKKRGKSNPCVCYCRWHSEVNNYVRDWLILPAYFSFFCFSHAALCLSHFCAFSLPLLFSLR